MRFIKKIKKISPRQWILILVFLIFFLFLRWNSFTTPFERDEGEYAYSAWIMRQGVIPYENSFLQKPPMIVYTYLFGQTLFGDNLWGPRVMSAIFTLFTSLLLFKISSNELGKTVGWMTLFIFAPIVISPINSGLAANTEIFMLLPLMGLWYLFTHLKYLDKYYTHLGLGVLAALAILYKPICVYLIGYLVIGWVIKGIRIIHPKGVPSFDSLDSARDKSAQDKSHTLGVVGKDGVPLHSLEVLKFVVLFVLGGMITTLLVLTPFLLSDGGRAFWEQVVVFNGYYMKHWGFGLGRLNNNLAVMAKSFWPLYVSLITYILIRPKRWRHFLALLFFALMGAYQTNIRHYFTITTPFLAIITAMTINTLTQGKIMARYRIWLTALVIAFILWPVRSQFGLTPEDLSLWIYGRDNPFYESRMVADRLADYTNKSDCVWVAGSEPQLYYYSKRVACNKFVITYPFIVKTPVRRGYQLQGIEALKANPPQAIVFSTKEHSGLSDPESPQDLIKFLEPFIRENYDLVGGWGWRESKGAWVDRFASDEELPPASLLLYVFKGGTL